MTTLIHNLQNLKDFIQGSASVPATTAATAIAQVAHDALSSPQVAPEHVKLAKLALLELCKNPQLDTIPHLLTICENNFSIYNVNAFLITSTAWKALTATCVKIMDPTQLPCLQRCRILNSALRGTTRILVDILASGSPQGGLDDLPQAIRSLKVAKFHCINAARCSKAFASLGKCGEECDEQIVTVVSTALYLVALTSLACSFHTSIPSIVSQSLTENIAPALGATLRSVLVMIADGSEEEQQQSGVRIISRALASLVREKEFANFAIKGLTNYVFQIIATLYLLRCSVYPNSEGCANNSDAQDLPGGTPVSNLPYPKAFARVLLPVLFTAVENSYAAVVTVRETQTGCLFLDCISACIEECIGRLSEDSKIFDENSLPLQEFLLVEMSASNPARALIAQRVIVRMVLNDQDAFRRKSLLLRVLQCARISLSLQTGHFSSRWIPLAGALALIYVRGEGRLGDVVHEYNSSQKVSPFQPLQSDANAIDDPVLLHLLAKVCDVMLIEKADRHNCDRPGGQSRNSDPVENVLLSLGASRAKLGGFVKELLLTGTNNPCLAEAALCVLPYLSDKQSLSVTALACLKRQGLTIGVYQHAINATNPQFMSSSSVQIACARMSTLIRNFGLAICASVTAFVARAAMCLHQSVSMNDWQSLSRLLELTILTIQQSKSADDVRCALYQAAVLYHAADALKVTNKISTASPGRQTQATIPKSVLCAIEEAQEKVQLMSNAMDEPDSMRTLANVHGLIAREVAFAKSHAGMETGFAGGESNEFVIAKNRLIDVTRRTAEKVGVGGTDKIALKLQVNELKDLVSALEGVAQGIAHHHNTRRQFESPKNKTRSAE